MRNDKISFSSGDVAEDYAMSDTLSMTEIHDFIASLCALRDELLYPDASAYDPLNFYTVDLELESSGEAGRWEVEVAATWNSGGGEESSSVLERRARIRIDRGSGITIAVGGGPHAGVRHYPLEPRGRDGCLDWLHDFLKRGSE